MPRLQWDDRRIEYHVALEKYRKQNFNVINPAKGGVVKEETQTSPEVVRESLDKNEAPALSDNKAVLPKRLIVCGQYRDLATDHPHVSAEYPFCALVDMS